MGAIDILVDDLMGVGYSGFLKDAERAVEKLKHKPRSLIGQTQVRFKGLTLIRE